jgi:hypothetical protein
MKKNVIIYWISTGFIALLEGVMPAFTSQTEMAKEGIRHLGYPEYFGNVLVVFKILGVLALVLPQIPKRVKEWAYAGFAFDFLFAAISHGIVDGLIGQTFFPVIVLGVLSISYIYYHKLNEGK